MSSKKLILNLAGFGIHKPAAVVHNPAYDLLFKEEVSPERVGSRILRLFWSSIFEPASHAICASA